MIKIFFAVFESAVYLGIIMGVVFLITYALENIHDALWPRKKK